MAHDTGEAAERGRGVKPRGEYVLVRRPNPAPLAIEARAEVRPAAAAFPAFPAFPDLPAFPVLPAPWPPRASRPNRPDGHAP